MSDSFTGVRIDGGLRPFQIIQQNATGDAAVDLHGSWRHPDNAGKVQLRIVSEMDGSLVCPWEDAAAQDARSWRHRFGKVPAGGLYRVETRLILKPYLEWNPSGDTIHHFGVGDLWVIAGQSNAVGWGRGAIYDPPRLGVHVLRNDEKWDIAAHALNEYSTHSDHPTLEKTSCGHSPYLAFGRALNDELAYPIGLIPTARGGSILSHWNPIENAEAPLWHNLIHCVRLAGGNVRGMIWYQGESDATAESADTYEQRLTDFIAAFRNELRQPELPVIVTQLNRCTNPLTAPDSKYWTKIRESQRRMGSKPNIAVVSTLDLALADPVHNNSESNVKLGLRTARTVAGMVFGKKTAWRAIEISRATLSDDRKSIDVRFTHVHSRLDFIAPSLQEFRVSDETGDIDVTLIDLIPHDGVRLKLAGECKGDVKLHLGDGMNPPSLLRDIEYGLAPLAFSNFPVTAQPCGASPVTWESFFEKYDG